MADYDSALPVRSKNQEDKVNVTHGDTNGLKVDINYDSLGGLKIKSTAGNNIVSDATYGFVHVSLRKASDGSELLGEKNMAGSIPVVIASDQTPINVNVISSAPTNPINIYKDDDVTTSTPVTHTYTTTGVFHLESVFASGSGAFKIEIQTGPTGTEATRAVAFGTSSTPNALVPFPNEIVVANGDNVLVIKTNRDKQTQTIYDTLNGWNE